MINENGVVCEGAALASLPCNQKAVSNAEHGNEAKGGGACDDSPWQTVSAGGW